MSNSNVIYFFSGQKGKMGGNKRVEKGTTWDHGVGKRICYMC